MRSVLFTTFLFVIATAQDTTTVAPTTTTTTTVAPANSNPPVVVQPTNTIVTAVVTGSTMKITAAFEFSNKTVTTVTADLPLPDGDDSSDHDVLWVVIAVATVLAVVALVAHSNAKKDAKMTGSGNNATGSNNGLKPSDNPASWTRLRDVREVSATQV